MKEYLINSKFVLFVYVLLVLVASIQSYFGNPTSFNNLEYTSYNNYIIFKQSFFHLIEGKDLYALYPSEHWDLYKYSPTFALLMAPLAILPDLIGLSFWNLLNAMILFFGIKKLKLSFSLSDFKNFEGLSYVLLYVSIELMTSLQNEQSNAIIAGLIILAFVLLEKEKTWLGTLCIALTFYIKIFGIVAFSLFLVYPQKGKFILSSVVWMIILGLLPMFVVGIEQFQFLYHSWWQMLGADHAASHGLSVMGWLKTWFGVDVSKNVIVLLGVVVFCLPLMKIKKYQDYDFRWRLLVSILIWIVIFNHKAESPTFIIAMSGVGIWYFFGEKSQLNLILVILTLVFTSLSPTDLFPQFLREDIINPYVLKVVPCILIWGKVIWEMWVLEPKTGAD